MTKSGKNILELQKEIHSMSEWKLIQKINSLDESIYIYDRNFAEFKKLLDFVSDERNFIQIWSMRNRDKMDALQRESLRLMHNYLSSVKSLVEHTRKQYKELYGRDNAFPEYNERIKKDFEDDPLIQFLQNLRNYFLHENVAPITAVFSGSRKSLDEELNTKSRFMLSAQKLLESDCFKTKSREYIISKPDHIDILEAINEYHQKIVNFYMWYKQKQHEIHKKEMDKLNQKQTEYMLAFRDIVFTQSLNMASQGGHMKPDDVFAELGFNQREWVELDKYPVDSAERIEQIIEFVQQRFEITDEIKEKIRKLYTQPT